MTAPTLLSIAIEMCFTARQQEKGAVAKCKIFTRYCIQHFKDIFIL